MKVFAENRKARNSYEFLEFFEAGIVLTGAETKSIRNGGLSIIDAFAIVENEEAIMREMNIEPYKYAEYIDYNPKAPRKLLLHKKEIKRLIGLISTKGLTLIATKVFEQNGLKVVCDLKSWLYLKNITIDYSDDMLNGGFKIENPNAERTCGCGTSFSA